MAIDPARRAPAAVAERQARLVGGRRRRLARTDRGSAAELLRHLVPRYVEQDAGLGARGGPNGGRVEQFVAQNGRPEFGGAREYGPSPVRDACPPGKRRW